MDPIALLDLHIPSLSDEDDEAIDKALFNILTEDGDNADLAIRTCRCGVRIDGFYEYVDHLKGVFRGTTT